MSSANNVNESFFSQYGKSFQEKIFQSLISDSKWSVQMIEVMTPTYFDLKYLQYLTEKYFSYYNKYKCFPTLSLLITIIRDDLRVGNDIILRDQIVEFLHRVKMNPDIGDLKFVKDKTLDFCKKQAMKDALEKAVEKISEGKLESVMDLVKHALSVGTTASIGHDFFEDIEARFTNIQRISVPTGLECLDRKDVLNGGLGKGEIGVVVANTGVGKSHFLVQVGAAALRRGKNVLHYTFELSETAVGTRYDSNLCDIPSNEVVERKEEIFEKYKDLDLGRLIIKEYPTGSASVLTIRSHIEKLSMKSFVPSVIIVDYADIMRSTRSYDALRHELKLVYEELRNLAMDMNIPIWTASQANRDSANSNIVGLENMSEAYGKAMVADVVISISRKSSEKSTGYARMFVAKNRAGRDGVLFPVRIDTAMSKFYTIEDASEMTLDDALQSDDRNLKKLLHDKWKEVNRSA
jgi:replicative DNA helicase